MPLGALLEKAKKYISPRKSPGKPSGITEKLKEKTRASVEEVLKNPVDPEKKAILDLLYNPQVPKEQKIGVKILNQVSRKERIVSGVTETGNLILDHYHAETGAKIREAFPRKVLEADQYRIKNSGNLKVSVQQSEKYPFGLHEIVTFTRSEKEGKERQGKVVGKDKNGNVVLVETGKERPIKVEKENVFPYPNKPIENNGTAAFTVEEIASGHAKRFFKKSNKKLNYLKNLAP